jgi:energy-coupling factor transport system permease protein
MSFRSALTASLATRMIPLLATDSERLAEAQRTRPAGMPTGPRARVALLGAVVGGSLDRAMDVAATLELRGFAAARPSRRSPSLRLSGAPVAPTGPASSSVASRSVRRPWSRHDIAFACSAVAVLTLSLLGRFGGAASFDAYPLVRMPLTAATGVVCAGLTAAVLLPFVDRRGIDP